MFSFSLHVVAAGSSAAMAATAATAPMASMAEMVMETRLSKTKISHHKGGDAL